MKRLPCALIIENRIVFHPKGAGWQFVFNLIKFAFLRTFKENIEKLRRRCHKTKLVAFAMQWSKRSPYVIETCYAMYISFDTRNEKHN